MKRLASILLALCLLCPTLAMAEHEAASVPPHQLLEIPYDIGIKETEDLFSERFDIVLDQSKDKNGIVRSLFAENVPQDLFTLPIKGITINFFESYESKDENGKTTTAYVESESPTITSMAVSLETEKGQSSDHYIARFASAFDAAQELYGDSWRGSMYIAKTLTSAALDVYDLPIKNNAIDKATLLAATNESILVNCEVIFGNVALSYFASSFSTATISASFNHSILSKGEESTPSLGYYGNAQALESITAPLDFSIRNGIRFGMSQDEVLALENQSPVYSTDSSMLYMDVSAAGKPATLIYTFVNDYLFSVFYLFTDSHTNDNEYIKDFESIDQSLTSKYGTPTMDQKYSWDNSLYKDDKEDYGFAIALGHLQIMSQWTMDNYLISHALSGDNYEIEHSLIYVVPSITPMTNTDGI